MAMQTSRSKTKPHYTFTDSSIPVMLRSTKALLSHKQYKNLCIAVNEAEGYHEKKKVIFRCIEPVILK